MGYFSLLEGHPLAPINMTHFTTWAPHAAGVTVRPEQCPQCQWVKSALYPIGGGVFETIVHGVAEGDTYIFDIQPAAGILPSTSRENAVDTGVLRRIDPRSRKVKTLTDGSYASVVRIDQRKQRIVDGRKQRFCWYRWDRDLGDELHNKALSDARTG